jgi:hypothetical protein
VAGTGDSEAMENTASRQLQDGKGKQSQQRRLILYLLAQFARNRTARRKA